MWLYMQGIEKIQEWKLGKFFSYACNDKNIKELFTPTWNGIAVSVRYVSSTQVILDARLNH